jgi:hypothetical protein
MTKNVPNTESVGWVEERNPTTEYIFANDHDYCVSL